MTQPNELDPAGSFAPLSITAGKTQEDWEIEMRSGIAEHFNPVEVAATWLLSTVQGIIDTIIEALTGLPVVGGVLGDVFDALDGLWNDAQSALSQVGDLAWNLLNDPVGTLGEIPQMLVSGLEGALSSIDGSINWILDQLENVPVIGDVIRIISGLGSRLFGFIPLANIADEPQTLLWNPGFTGAVSLEPGSGWSWDSTVYRTGGDSEPGAAKAVADGTIKVLRSNSASVAAGKKLPVEVHVLSDGLTGTGDLLQLGLLFFDGDTQVDSVVVDSVGVPTDPHSWAAGVTGARMATLSGEVTIPEGVDRVQMRLIVTANATAGTVWWDDADMKLSGLLQQSWTEMLPEDLGSLFNWIGSLVDHLLSALGETPIGGLLDRILGLGDALEGVAQDAWSAVSGVGQLAWDLLNDPVSVLGTIPQSLVGGLETTLNQIGDIFNGLVVTPINSVVGAIRDWFHSWFGGGSSSAIPASQKGAPGGVAPLDGNGRVPLAHMPDIALPEGDRHPHVLLTLPADLAVPSGTETDIGGWQASGSETPIFDDPTNTRFQLPLPGWWQLESQLVWESSAVGKRQSALCRRLPSDTTVVVDASGASADDFPLWGPRTKTVGMQDVTAEMAPLGADDLFSVKAYQDSGGPLNVVAGYPHGSYLLATYLGERQEDAVTVGTVTFDAAGTGGTGTSSTSWSHSASGADRAVVVFVYFVLGSGATPATRPRTVTYGGTPMTSLGYSSSFPPILGLVPYVEAFVLLNPPTGSRTVSVSLSGGTVNGVAGNSLSYNNVSGHRALQQNTGTGASHSHTVTSQTHRRVAQAFLALKSSFQSDPISGYNQTQRSGVTAMTGWAYGAIGDAPGASSVDFSASMTLGNHWASLAVDLRAAGEP